MDLAEMLTVLWRSKWIILIASLITAGIVAYNEYSKETVYQAETSLMVSDLGISTTFSREDLTAASYTELAMTDAVRKKALGNSKSSNSGSSSVTAATVKDSPFINVTALSSSPEESVSDANSIAHALVDYVYELKQQSLAEQRDSLLRELSEIEEDMKEVRSKVPVDEARLNALDSVRQSVIRQYEELNAGLLQSDLLIVDEAENAHMVASHPIRNSIIGLLLGAVAGIIIGFSANSVRTAIRREE